MTILRALLALRRAARERWLANEELRCMPMPEPNWLHGDEPMLGFYTAEMYDEAEDRAQKAQIAFEYYAEGLAEALFPRK